MRKSRYQLQKERRETRAALEREKDTIYFLDFIPKDGQPVDRTTLLNDPWCVRLPNGRKDDPIAIEDAIHIFEKKHGVDCWKEVASSYDVNGLYYP